MYFSINSDEVIKQFGSSLTNGLSSTEAKLRLEKYGKNELVQKSKISVFHLFLSQMSELMSIILLISGIIAYLLGETIDGTIIIFIVILNAIIGVIQEFKAEKAIDALKKMISPNALVIRDGAECIISADDLVPGDIIVLEEGSKIPADARIVEASSLHVDEAALTGESVPRNKNADVIADKNVPLADMSNILFMGTAITNGRCKAIVIETGMKTEFGKIAKLTSEIKEDKSPLQKEINYVGSFIAKVTFVICILVFVVGLIKGHELFEMFLFAVSLGVAAVPEGLPATMTIALAIGVQRMARKKAIIRKLSSVETLGSTTVICTDKTGTLTKNQMTVRKIFLDGKIINVSGEGYAPVGEFTLNNKPYKSKILDDTLRIGLLCSNAVLEEEAGVYKILGDTTEGALVVSATKSGLNHKNEEQEYKRIYEIPFSSSKRMMITVHERKTKSGKKEYIAFMKGSPETVVEKCSFIEKNGKARKITKKDSKDVLVKNEELDLQALRVLAFAYKKLKTSEVKNLSKLKDTGFTLLGLQGMIDPPRPEVSPAVEKCKSAGIRIFVITGDNGLTARAISKEIGLADDNTKIITGTELDALSDYDLTQNLKSNIIFARMTAENKMRIVDNLIKSGEIVAVTGDGVNDAPALKRADIGIAMGITGTDVSKEASKMVLTDDSFATIVNAIEEGRTIYANINKFIRYMISSNLGEIIAVLLSIFFILPNLPPEYSFITAIQLLWINLGTDVLPALSLGLEPAESGIMTRPPRNTKVRIISHQHIMEWATSGFVMGVGSVIIFILYDADPIKASTMAFTMLVIYELTNVFNCRHATRSIFETNFFSNKFLLFAIFSSLVLQLTVIYHPALQPIFHTTAITVYDWLVILFFSSFRTTYEEVRKLFTRRLAEKNKNIVAA